ncbi:NERD domain-containing protein [Nocardia flavorosea]|uniref:NERD domain-containing protein n=1 Tax=Nocardia flavorosea TaxID=53429 RepID=UPI002456659E|nr:NERD domain-containing protein [Nocardia flavorosea]
MGTKPTMRTSLCTRRWTAVNESTYGHERSALERIRAAMPDADPWRAWSNFSFATATGRLFEVDLLITAPSGLYLVELKSWRGRLTATESGCWVQTKDSNQQITHGRPLQLTLHKSTALERLLCAAGEYVAVRPVLCLSNDQLQIELPGRERRHTLTVDSLLERLSRPTHNACHRMPRSRVDGIERALASVGIAPPEQLLSAEWPGGEPAPGLSGIA